MATAVVDLAGLLKGIPAGAWVAISESQHKVMAYAVDAQTALRMSQEQGESNPLIVRVPDQTMSMFFLVR